MHQPAAVQEGTGRCAGRAGIRRAGPAAWLSQGSGLTGVWLGIKIAVIVGPSAQHWGARMRKFGILLAAGLAVASVAAQAQDIGIGLDIPLSAPGDAAGGQFIRRGAEIGIETVNAAGGVMGKKLKLFVTDSQSTPQMGVANYRRLVSEDKVVAVTGKIGRARVGK